MRFKVGDRVRIVKDMFPDLERDICGEGILDGTWFIEETGCKI